jgi:hypothetical protein
MLLPVNAHLTPAMTCRAVRDGLIFTFGPKALCAGMISGEKMFSLSALESCAMSSLARNLSEEAVASMSEDDIGKLRNRTQAFVGVGGDVWRVGTCDNLGGRVRTDTRHPAGQPTTFQNHAEHDEVNHDVRRARPHAEDHEPFLVSCRPWSESTGCATGLKAAGQSM